MILRDMENTSKEVGRKLAKEGFTSRPPIKLARSWRYRCPTALRYAIAIALVGLAWTTTYALRSSVDAPSFQTPLFVCAIVLSSWVGGAGPGMVATLLSIFSIEYTFTEPRFTFGFTWSEVPKFTVFFFTGSFISWLAGRQRRDEEALLVARESLEENVRERTSDLQLANEKLTDEVADRIAAEKELQRLNGAWRVRSLFNRSVARSQDEHDLLRRVCQTLVKIGGYQLAWVAFLRDGKIYPDAYASGSGFETLDPAWQEGGPGQGLALRSISSSEPTACNLNKKSSQIISDAWAEKHNIRAVLALPLIPEHSAIGSLVVYSNEQDAFDEKETELLQQAANDVAQGLVVFRARAAQVQAESALEKSQSELARVARVTMIGELTASIAHEINQPLAAVVTNASACLRWIDREQPDLNEAREAARRIIRDGKRGSEVIARIRALLKNEAPTRGLLAVNEVIEEILTLVRDEMKGVELVSDLAVDLSLVAADRVQLQQVLLNLILNAIDSMATVEDRPKTLRIQTRRNSDKSIEVSVRDSGMGLPPDRLEQVFETFYTTKKNGLGMGLSICRSIIEQHGGRLWAEMNDGAGATFRFTLPLEKE